MLEIIFAFHLGAGSRREVTYTENRGVVQKIKVLISTYNMQNKIMFLEIFIYLFSEENSNFFLSYSTKFIPTKHRPQHMEVDYLSFLVLTNFHICTAYARAVHTKINS